ncbi:alanine acetyltransferase [Xanthomonas melonis]|uniref:Alanine acetyltransferase n=1 Tax=Xanthomonas melonis TaxID=56456 RepID=A0A2S7DM16_9XANT|nr:alanine acetyltransferase [Xanthomonas melonis]MCC4598973.1 DNA polymerase III subunit psi [Xanthomonas melonis]PPU74873.1 alanine acetyltransferase [Xanthomonas melonis]
MSEPAHMPTWSDLQVSCLQAMGHTVYLDRDSVETLPAVVEMVQDTPAAAPARAPHAAQPAAPEVTPAVRRQAPAPALPPVPATSAVPVRRGRVGLPDRLQMALLRASGCNPGDPATQALMASWPLSELRGNPAAKRALWPQLRALRRRQGPA